MLDEPPSAESLGNLQKIVPGCFCKGRLLFAPLNCAWHLEATLRAWQVPFRFIPPKPTPAMKWSEIVDATRSELLDWVPNFLALYQKLAIVFAQRAPDESAHLHHPTGSGKSISGITWGLIRPLPIVFVTKAAARETIRREFERYTTVRPVVLTPKSERKASAPDPVLQLQQALEAGTSPRAVIVAWESLTEYTDLLVQLGSYSLVMDEIHMAKEHRRWLKLPNIGDDPDELSFARRDNRAAHIQRIAANARRRLGLTATPIPDRRRDLWAQLDLVHPKAWGRFWDFCARYTDLTTSNHGNLDNTGESNTEELDQRMSFVCHKVDYSVTHRELPPKRRQVLYIAKAQQGRPDAFADEMKRAMKLGHKRCVEVSLAESASRKRPVLLDQVADVARSGGKVVVLTGRHKDCERWELALEKRLPKVRRWMAHGGHGTAVRDAIREEYMAHPGPCVLIGTGDAWGESVSLHDTDLAVNAMLPITPKQLWQREGRFHRQGGKRSVLILYPVAEGTIDEHMQQIMLSKLPSVADLQKDSDFIQAMNDLKSSGLSEQEIVESLFAKITAGADAPSEEGATDAEQPEPEPAGPVLLE